MKKFLVCCFLLFSGIIHAMGLEWDPNPVAENVTGYIVQYGTVSGVYSTVIDVGNVTSTPINLPPGTYYFTVVAYNANSVKSGYSAEVVAVVPQPPIDTSCDSPLGSKTISIFPTNLQKTGSGGAGSRARLDFQISSSSPITHVAVKANGVDLSTMDGTQLAPLAGMWFTVPTAPAKYVFSINAQNLYGCTKDVPTSYSISVK